MVAQIYFYEALIGDQNEATLSQESEIEYYFASQQTLITD